MPAAGPVARHGEVGRHSRARQGLLTQPEPRRYRHETHQTFDSTAARAVCGLYRRLGGGGSLFATSVNPGLVNALDSVGKNLFGSAVFAVAWPPTPITPTEPVRLFVADNSQIPLALNVFWPPNPITPTELCHSYLQVSVDPGAGVVVKVDPAFMPEDFTADVQFASLASEKPVTSQCPATIDQGETDG